MDLISLKTAADYINNLLLARGLLRNGTPVEFMQFARKKEESNAALGQVINLVHDLILRRDRDQSHQEELASSLRSLESDAQQSISIKDRLISRNKDLERQLVLAQSEARNAQTALRTAEASARTLRDEMIKVKSTLVQVRKQCDNDVRKRDTQIQKLKSHLTAQQRGGAHKTSVVGPSISLNQGASLRSDARNDDCPSLQDAEYSLKQETTEFLTQLSQSLSDENDSLLALVRSTIKTLKDLQGIQEGINNHTQSQAEVEPEVMIQGIPITFDELASELQGVLGNLQDLLTNPSFAPIEEVQLREDEIIRLRAGWEKMEGRWQEAVGMMEGWQKRMLSGGDTVNLEELKMGLGLGNGLEALGTANPAMILHAEEDTDDDSSLHEMNEPKIDDLVQDLPSDEENPIPGHNIGSPGVFNFPRDPSLQELDSNINLGPMVTTRDHRKATIKASRVPRKVSQPSKSNKSSAAQRTGSLKRQRKASADDEPPSQRRSTPYKKAHFTSLSNQSYSQSPSPSPSPAARSLTIPQKLALAALEARRVSSSSSPLDLGINAVDARAAPSSPVRRTRITGRPVRRRKSTLSPEELDGLLLGTMGV